MVRPRTIPGALARIASRDGRGNLFEQEEDLRRVAEVFDRIEGDFVLRLDGTLPIDVLAERLDSNRNALYKLLHDARRRLRAHVAAAGFPEVNE